MTFALEALGFHVGMVVNDTKAVVDAYEDLFGGSFQIWEAPKAAPRQVDPSYEDSQLLIAYGRYAGMTIEVIQVLSGQGHYARWLERHGEGVQHLGFWVPELAPAVERALEHGATLASATVNPDLLGAVTITGLSPSSIAKAILPGSVHMNYAQETTEIELLGPSSIETLRSVFGQRLPEIVNLPAWDA